MINIAEILKDCPKGTKLYSTIHGEVELVDIYHDLIRCKFSRGISFVSFHSNGRWIEDVGECVIFPSKDQRDWCKFHRPFKDGDILTYTGNYTNTFIYRNKDNEPHLSTSFYVACNDAPSHNFLIYNKYTLIALNENCDVRLATEDEKIKLFDAIKANGYKWNAETKTLEKLIVPKFKVGDEIVKKNSISNSFIVNSVSSDYYGLVLPDRTGVGVLNVSEQDDWELVSIIPKFKVGDRIKLNNSRFIYTITDLLKDRYRATTDSCDLYEIEFERQDAYKLVPNHKFKVGDKIVKKDNPTECWYVQGVDTNCNSGYFYYIVTKSKIANLHFRDQDDWELAPVPKFKVGDIVKSNRNTLFDYKIIKITDTHYTLESIPGANTYDMFICEDENWKLVPNKFDISTLKAYDKVLVRDSNEREWCADLFSHILDRPLGCYTFCCVGDNPKQCIPYEGNEHLLGTCDDCGEYYKNW